MDTDDTANGRTARAVDLPFRLLSDRAIPPRTTRLEVPGWSGERVPPQDGAPPQPWHCQPFAEGATYGFELLYPYNTECEVLTDTSGVHFVGDFAGEIVPGQVWPPFRIANDGHYSVGSMVDIEVPPDHCLRIEPHPRFFTDQSDTVPAAVIGNLQTSVWPMFFFVTFRSPRVGQRHVFRHGEPYAQVIVVPSRPQFRLTPMTEEQARARQEAAANIHRRRDVLAKRHWTSDAGHSFDDTYRQLTRRR